MIRTLIDDYIAQQYGQADDLRKSGLITSTSKLAFWGSIT